MRPTSMMSRQSGYRRLAALASLLLASTLLAGSGRAQPRDYSPRVQPPRDARECGLISAEVFTALYDLTNEPEAIAEFLKNTDLDRILKHLCDQRRYDEAFRLGKSYLDGFDKEKAAPRRTGPVGVCVANDTVEDWIVNANAEKYTLSIFGKVVSGQERRQESSVADRLQQQAERAMQRGPAKRDKLSRSGQGGSLAIDGKPGDAQRLYRIDVGFSAPGEPELVDVELTPEGGEPRRGKARLASTNWVDVTALLEDVKTGTRIRVKVDYDGTTLMVGDIPYPHQDRATYRALQLQGRLARDRNAGRCTSRQCFLTTACCELVGLPDDCFELRTMRHYRDQVMLATPDGAFHVAMYYALAPVILRSMRARGEERRLIRYYFSHVLPCALLAYYGFNRAALHRYIALTTRLCNAYAPDQIHLVHASACPRLGA